MNIRHGPHSLPGKYCNFKRKQYHRNRNVEPRCCSYLITLLLLKETLRNNGFSKACSEVGVIHKPSISKLMRKARVGWTNMKLIIASCNFFVRRWVCFCLFCKENSGW